MNRILALILIIFASLHGYRINDGPNGFHTWRETDTATVAANFFSETRNILEPRIDVRGLGDGKIGMEFPIYSYVIGGLFYIGGHDHYWARGFTVAGAMLLILALFKLSQHLFPTDIDARFIAYAAACSPLLFFYARKIQPDIWGLNFSLWGLYWFLKSVDRKSLSLLLGSWVVMALGALIKPTMLAVGMPIAVYLYRSGGVKAFLRRYASDSDQLEFGPFKLDLNSHQFFNKGKEIKLMPKEFKLLQFFIGWNGESLQK